MTAADYRNEMHKTVIGCRRWLEVVEEEIDRGGVITFAAVEEVGRAAAHMAYEAGRLNGHLLSGGSK